MTIANKGTLEAGVEISIDVHIHSNITTFNEENKQLSCYLKDFC